MNYAIFFYRKTLLSLQKAHTMKEEFTTAMHEELIGKEISHRDLLVAGVFGAIRRGIPKKEALKKYGISEDFYDSNIKRVLSS